MIKSTFKYYLISAIFRLDLSNFPPRVYEGVFYFMYIYDRKYCALIKRQDDDENDEGYVYFSFEELSVYLGKDYVVDIINLLESTGILKRKPEYNQYGYSKNHFELKEFEKGGIRVVKNNILKKNLIKWRKLKNKNLSREAKAQAKYLKDIDIDIDFKTWMSYADKCYERYLSKKATKKKLNPKAEIKIKSYDAYKRTFAKQYSSVEVFNSSDKKDSYEFIHDTKFAGRIYNVVNNLPSLIRNAYGVVKYKGAPLIGVDVKQCQAMLLAVVLLQKSANSKYAEIFLEVDDIYIYIKEELGLESRDEAKVFLYHCIFGGIRNPSIQKFKKLFYVDYFNITNIKSKFYKMMPTHGRDKEKAKHEGKKWEPLNYKNVAWILQKKEVQIFKDIWSNFHAINVPFVSVYDEIMVPEHDVIAVKFIMTDILKNYFHKSGVKVNDSFFYEKIHHGIWLIDKDGNKIPDIRDSENNPLDPRYKGF